MTQRRVSGVSGVSDTNRLLTQGLPCVVAGATGFTGYAGWGLSATGSYEDTFGSPATSLSITEHAAHLYLMTLITLPELLDTDQDLFLDITQSSLNGLPPPVPVPSVVLPPAGVSWEGTFDTATEPAAAGNNPLISTDVTGCPYRITTYCEEDIACVDSACGVQAHHPRFLECIGAPESSPLLGRPLAEWMDRRDVLVAAMQLQWDATLLASNLTVLKQYVVSLHRRSMEVLQSVFGQELFPACVVEDAAPVPCVCSAVYADGGDGTLASTGWTGRSEIASCTPGRRLLWLCHMSSTAVRLAVCPGLTRLPPVPVYYNSKYFWNFRINICS